MPPALNAEEELITPKPQVLTSKPPTIFHDCATSRGPDLLGAYFSLDIGDAARGRFESRSSFIALRSGLCTTQVAALCFALSNAQRY
jgi:hypothetical protein